MRLNAFSADLALYTSDQAYPLHQHSEGIWSLQNLEEERTSAVLVYRNSKMVTII
jgi:hypothetical protein